MGRDIDLARDAFEKKDAKLSKLAHNQKPTCVGEKGHAEYAPTLIAPIHSPPLRMAPLGASSDLVQNYPTEALKYF